MELDKLNEAIELKNKIDKYEHQIAVITSILQMPSISCKLKGIADSCHTEEYESCHQEIIKKLLETDKAEARVKLILLNKKLEAL